LVKYCLSYFSGSKVSFFFEVILGTAFEFNGSLKVLSNGKKGGCEWYQSVGLEILNISAEEPFVCKEENGTLCRISPIVPSYPSLLGVEVRTVSPLLLSLREQ